jgi:hypothetical protein
MSVITAMGKFTNVQTEYAIKDNLPRDATNITAQIIVGTPGTMTDLIRRKVSRNFLFRLLLSYCLTICSNLGHRCQSY